jgi:hypothetical protein
MKKTLTALLAAATMAVALAGSATDASAQFRRWGPAVGLGVIGGFAIGSILASRPPGYVVYRGYNAPLYAPGCYWAAQPLYDPYGRFVGYSGQPIQVCPGM